MKKTFEFHMPHYEIPSLPVGLEEAVDTLVHSTSLWELGLNDHISHGTFFLLFISFLGIFTTKR